MSIRAFFSAFFHKHALVRTFLLITLILMSFSIIIHLVEPESFPTLFDAVWWVIVTSTTIGYGDFVPKTIIGRLITILLIFSGVGFVTYYMVSVANKAMKSIQQLHEGGAAYDGKNHIIIIGWNERSKIAVEQLLANGDERDIILIDESLQKIPLFMDEIYFIKGDPSDDEVLLRAKAATASVILITADQYRNEKEADLISIAILLAAKGINPAIYGIVEILTVTQQKNALRAGADEIIRSNEMISYTMKHSLTTNRNSSHVIMSLAKNNNICFSLSEPPEQLHERTCKDALLYYLEQDKVLVGIQRGEEIHFSPSLSFLILKNDLLIFMEQLRK